MKMTLRLQRANGPLQAEHAGPFEVALASAARLLADALDNTLQLGLAQGEHSRADLMAARTALSASAWDQELVGEAALGVLHDEHSGWGLPATEAVATPRLVAAIDVIDWMVAVMGPADRLVLEITSA